MQSAEVMVTNVAPSASEDLFSDTAINSRGTNRWSADWLFLRRSSLQWLYCGERKRGLWKLSGKWPYLLAVMSGPPPTWAKKKRERRKQHPWTPSTWAKTKKEEDNTLENHTAGIKNDSTLNAQATLQGGMKRQTTQTWRELQGPNYIFNWKTVHDPLVYQQQQCIACHSRTILRKPITIGDESIENPYIFDSGDSYLLSTPLCLYGHDLIGLRLISLRFAVWPEEISNKIKRISGVAGRYQLQH